MYNSPHLVLLKLQHDANKYTVKNIEKIFNYGEIL